MKREDYQRVLGAAHAVRILARSVASLGMLDEAIDAIGRADSVGAMLDPTLYRDRHAAMAQDDATLRMVRMLAQLGESEDLAGEGSTPEPGSATSRASGSLRGTQAPSPAEQARPGVPS